MNLDDLDALIAEQDENECAKPFTYSERVDIANEIKLRMGDRRGANQYTKEDGNDDSHAERGKTDDLAARAAGFGSKFSYQKAKAVVEHGVSDLIEAMDEGTVSVSAAAEVAPSTRARRPQDREQPLPGASGRPGGRRPLEPWHRRAVRGVRRAGRWDARATAYGRQFKAHGHGRQAASGEQAEEGPRAGAGPRA